MRFHRSSLAIVALAVLLLVGCGDSTEIATTSGVGGDDAPPVPTVDTGGDDAPPVSTVDTAAVTASVNESIDAFWAAGERQSRARDRCEVIEEVEARTECALSRRLRRVIASGIADGKAAMSGVSADLDQLSDGAGQPCADAVSLWADDAEAWALRQRRLDLVTRQEGYADDNRRIAVANLAYRRALAKGDPTREDVNRLRVLVACSPDESDRNQLKLGSDYLNDYHVARYTTHVQNELRSVCFATTGGSYYEGSESETTVKTCLARTTRNDSMSAAVKQMNASFAALRDSSAWASATASCKRAISKVVRIQRSETQLLGRLNRIESSNDTSRDATYDALNSIDYDGKLAAQQKLPACIRSLAETA